MLRSFIVNVVLFAIAIMIAFFVVRVFDDWYQDVKETRDAKRNQERHRRYE